MVGPAEIVILMAVALPALAVLIGVVVFATHVNKNKTDEPVPSYNELKVENANLRNEVNGLRERLDESAK